jgi:hypothetical protein
MHIERNPWLIVGDGIRIEDKEYIITKVEQLDLGVQIQVRSLTRWDRICLWFKKTFHRKPRGIIHSHEKHRL